ncbi:VWA domain-containing protein [Adlercreutzia sp. ZJ138]|uniref:DUF7604 domain-containing protein n=1 Tax=Adlercreutzia sp. ZJ138 TaxID=2709405 RepID=UPI0013EDED1E|nr:VWA domain-containing protein [Adlercreutzia sp. ZJ138]
MRAYLEAARRNRKLQRIAFTAAVFAAVFVVFGVFWALKNTGIAMTGDPTCGLAEHTHSDACYTQTLACGQEEAQAHQHSVANGCYAATQPQQQAADGTATETTSEATQAASSQTLTCTTPETPGHTHTDACYQKTLTCTTPEHTHSESCYGDAKAGTETPQQWEATLPTNLTGTWPSDVVAVAQSQLNYAESKENLTTNENGEQKGYTRYGAWANTPYANWSVPFAAFCLHYAGANEYPVALTCPEWTQALQSPEYGLYHPVESGYEPKPGDVVFFAKEEDAEKVATARTQAAEKLAQAQVQAAAVQGAEAGQGEEAAAQDAQNAEIAAQDQAVSAYAEVTALADHVGIVEALLPADQNNPDRIRVIQGDAEDATSHTDKVQSIEYERSADYTDTRILGYAEVPENAEALQKIVETRIATSGFEDMPTVYTTDTASVGRTIRSATATIANAKTIDRLDKGNQNPDTSLNGTDLYRLYLDAKVKVQQDDTPIEGTDLLIIVDESASMYNKQDIEVKNSPNPIARDAAVRLILNGTTSKDSFNQEGLIYKFLNANPTKNRVAVIGFRGKSDVVNDPDAVVLSGGWTSNPAAIKVDGENGGGTNYCAGLKKAEELLKNANSENQKTVLFLSDGVPTYYLAQNSKGGEDRLGNGGEEDKDNVTKCNQPTKDYFKAFFERNGIPVSTVGIFPDNQPNSEIDREDVLKYMATTSGGQYTKATTAEDIEKALWQTVDSSPVTELVIEDTLSGYADVYSHQPDFLVTMTKDEADGTPSKKVLWDSGGRTDEGNGKLKNVGLDPNNQKRVVAEFEPGYHPEDGWIYTLSFNIRPSDAAYEYKKDHVNYPDTGDEGTDYESSDVTDTNRRGFHSNASASNTSESLAKVSYKINGVQGSNPYAHPIIQVSDTKPGFDPVVSGGELDLMCNKTIDAFRDGVDNPDTEVQEGLNPGEETDLYRLYLDAVLPESKDEQGVDLVIVVDESWSMQAQDMKDTTSTDSTNNVNLRRYQAISQVLNGTADSTQFNEENRKKGLIYDFLDMNSANKVAVVGFNGYYSPEATRGAAGDYLSQPSPEYYYEQYYSDYDGYWGTRNRYYDWKTGKKSNGYDVDPDARAYTFSGNTTNWMTGGTAACEFVDVQADGHEGQGLVTVSGTVQDDHPSTNYCAGLWKAAQLFKGVEDDSNKKVMIFLSDGVPTFFVNASNGQRWGSGWARIETDKTLPDYGRCITGTMEYYRDVFMKDIAGLGVDIYTVGIEPENSSSGESAFDDTILKQMVNNDASRSVSVGDTETLKNAMRTYSKCPNVNNFKIEDTLSDYVDLYSETDPGYKVVKKDKNGETVLWPLKWNETTKNYESYQLINGRPIVQSVSHEGKKVSAIFNPAYELEAGCTYTLSFNIEVNNYAYGQYETLGYKYPDEGDEGTDYLNTTDNQNILNKTSSYEPGFDSNKEAMVSYVVNGDATPKTKKYKTPVVQVSYKLPETGGGGIWTNLVVGAVLVTGAGVGLAAKRRRKCASSA